MDSADDIPKQTEKALRITSVPLQQAVGAVEFQYPTQAIQVLAHAFGQTFG